MCGFIAGIFPKDAAPDDAALSRALDAIGHRGPDGRSVVRIDMGDQVAVFGHVRLAMVGLSNGTQPFVTPDTVLAVNGEFYDHVPARRRLEAMGSRFTTDTDSEIALHAWEATGTDDDAWLASLRGEWVLALLDRRNGNLTAACDPSGVRPLRHWTSRDGRAFAVASEAKALFALGVPREVDDEVVRFAMEFQYLPFGRTLFRGVGMLPPGCRIDHDRDGTRMRPWHDPVATRSLAGDGFREFLDDGEALAVDRAIRSGTRADRATAVSVLLRGAVRRRVPGEVSFATHLSGGLDSAAVTALLGEITGRRGIDAFCAAFPWGEDEVGQAAVTARHIGARLIPVEMTPAALVRGMDEAAFHAEGPSINAHAGAKMILSRAIRDAGHKCAFTGEGADEAFLGYEHLRADFPTAGRPVTDDVNPATLGVHRPDGDCAGPDAVWQRFGFVPTFVRGKASAAEALRGTFGPRLRAASYEPARIVGDLPQPWQVSLRSASRPERSRALWSVYALSGYILRGLDDATGMASAVESRLAFLDPALRGFASMLPPSDHYAESGLEKDLLRRAVADLLPAEVLARPKRPFMAPSLTATPEGASWSRERLLDGRLATTGLFDRRGLEALLASTDRPARESGVLALASLSALADAFDLN